MTVPFAHAALISLPHLPIELHALAVSSLGLWYPLWWLCEDIVSSPFSPLILVALHNPFNLQTDAAFLESHSSFLENQRQCNAELHRQWVGNVQPLASPIVIPQRLLNMGCIMYLNLLNDSPTGRFPPESSCIKGLKTSNIKMNGLGVLLVKGSYVGRFSEKLWRLTHAILIWFICIVKQVSTTMSSN